MLSTKELLSLEDDAAYHDSRQVFDFYWLAHYRRLALFLRLSELPTLILPLKPPVSLDSHLAVYNGQIHVDPILSDNRPCFAVSSY